MSDRDSKADHIENICPTCKGTGSLPEIQPVKRGEPLAVSAMKCPDCGGTGRKPKPS